MTGRERAWNALVFVAWLAVMGALAGWYLADRAKRPQPQVPDLSPVTPPEDPPADAEQAGLPPRHDTAAGTVTPPPNPTGRVR